MNNSIKEYSSHEWYEIRNRLINHAETNKEISTKEKIKIWREVGRIDTILLMYFGSINVNEEIIGTN